MVIITKAIMVSLCAIYSPVVVAAVESLLVPEVPDDSGVSATVATFYLLFK